MILTKIKNRATGWRPLVLYWRRRRVLHPALKRDRVSSPVSISYFPQIHFHFTTVLTQKSLTRMFSGTTVYRERVLRERAGNEIYTDKTQAPLNERRPLRINYVSSASASTSTSISSLSIKNTHLLTLRGSKGLSAPIRQIQQPRQSVSIKSTPLSLHTRRVELTKVFRSNSHTRELQPTQALSNKTRIQFDRTEELVWRRNERRRVVSEDAPVTNNTEVTQRSTARTPAATTHVQSVSAPGNQTTPQQITKFDPSLLDRLTDDVIRRVEKRALVERQRRGL